MAKFKFVCALLTGLIPFFSSCSEQKKENTKNNEQGVILKEKEQNPAKDRNDSYHAFLKHGDRLDATSLKSVVAISFYLDDSDPNNEIDVCDEDVSQLTETKVLESVNLSGSKITDAGLKTICKVGSITSLFLSHTQITNRGCKEIVNLDKLLNLDLSGTKITSKGIIDLAQLSRLEYLQVSDTEITDSAMEVIPKLGKLRHLDVSGTKITDEGFKKLLHCSSLRYLVVHLTPISKEMVLKLEKNNKNLEIGHDHDD